MQFIQCPHCKSIQQAIEAESVICYDCKSPIHTPELLSEDEIFIDNPSELPFCEKPSRKSAIERQQEALKQVRRHRITQELMASAVIGQTADSQPKKPLSFLNSFFSL